MKKSFWWELDSEDLHQLIGQKNEQYPTYCSKQTINKQ